MAERCFPLDNINYSAEDMQLYLCTRSSGVYTLDSCLRVTAGTGLAVSVEPGLAWLKIGDFAGLAYCNDANNTLTHDAADTTYPRIDRVIVRETRDTYRTFEVDEEWVAHDESIEGIKGY